MLQLSCEEASHYADLELHHCLCAFVCMWLYTQCDVVACSCFYLFAQMMTTAELHAQSMEKYQRYLQEAQVYTTYITISHHIMSLDDFQSDAMIHLVTAHAITMMIRVCDCQSGDASDKDISTHAKRLRVKAQNLCLR